MTRLALALTLAAGPVVATPGLNRADPGLCAEYLDRPGAVRAFAGGDAIVLAPTGRGAAIVCYWNGHQVSRHGDYTLDLDGLVVRFFRGRGRHRDADHHPAARLHGVSGRRCGIDRAGRRGRHGADRDGSELMTTTYEIRARRPSDFALVEDLNTNEREAKMIARQFFANGYDVTVTLVTREHVAEWKQEDRKDG